MGFSGTYMPRHVDGVLERLLEAMGAVVVEGPKWCGKTTTCFGHAASRINLADPRQGYRNRRMAELDVYQVLEGPRPRLVDEWQEVPSVWDAVRFECDEAGEPGQFMLTGSATPSAERRPLHSGAGRMGWLRMDTMTWSELGHSSRTTSFDSLFYGASPGGIPSLDLPILAERICAGGWPQNAHADVDTAMQTAENYIRAVAREDMDEAAGRHVTPEKVEALIHSLARNESTLASKKTIRLDTVGSSGEAALSAATIQSYLDILERMYFVDDIPAWHPTLHSPVRIRAAKKHHLADTSLAVAALHASPKMLLDDLKTMGQLFESLVAHDVRVYARLGRADLYHYHDDSDLEVDLIVQKRSGEWGAIEVKLGHGQVNDAASNLNRLERKLVTRGERPPAFKAVIVGIGALSERRDDGVLVVPFDTLTV